MRTAAGLPVVLLRRAQLLINRVSIPRFFSPQTTPRGATGYCVEVTCMKGDERWKHAGRLSDWVVDDLMKVGLVRDRRNVRDIRVERLPESYPVYRKDYPQQLDVARSQLAGFSTCASAGRTVLVQQHGPFHRGAAVVRLLREAGRADAEEARLARGISAANGLPLAEHRPLPLPRHPRVPQRLPGHLRSFDRHDPPTRRASPRHPLTFGPRSTYASCMPVAERTAHPHGTAVPGPALQVAYQERVSARVAWACPT